MDTYYIDGQKFVQKLQDNTETNRYTQRFTTDIIFKVATIQGDIETYKNKYRLIYGKEFNTIDIVNDKEKSTLIINCASYDNLIHLKGSLCSDLFKHGVFEGYESLRNVNLGLLETSQVTDMSYMFKGCGELETIDISNFDTSNVIDMNNMFRSCRSLIDLKSNFNTNNLIVTKGMFYDCMSLEYLDLSTWNTDKLKDARGMFTNCSIDTLITDSWKIKQTYVLRNLNL